MHLLTQKIIFKFLFSILILSGFLLVPYRNIYAASLSLSPGSSTVSVGNIISLRVLVNTSSKYINNSEATVQFPTDMLEVVSVTKSSSIFTLWVEEPSFSNYTGKIVFNGGVPTPGYNGGSGYIATITFKAKKQGTASVILTDAAVRENDGLGTDILTSKTGSTIVIGVPKVIEVPTPITTPAQAVTPTKEKSLIPDKPVITSDTHPDQNAWYSKNTATFNWKIPNGVTKIQTLYSKDPNGNPTISYDNSVTQKTLNNLKDGTSYFHLIYYNSVGKSLISHYKLNIDTISPILSIPTIRNENNNNLIKLDASDILSGIDYYTLKIDDNTEIKVGKSDLYNQEYILPVLNEGDHNIIVVAYDKANNKTESTSRFNSKRIISPELSLSSNEITRGDTVTILGNTQYPNTKIEVKLDDSNNSNFSNIIGINSSNKTNTFIQTTDENGNFSITTPPIKTNGTIGISAEIIFSDKVKSNPSEIIYLKVKDTKVVSTTLSLIPPILSIIIVSLLLIVLTIIIYIGWHKFFGLRRKLNRELQNTATEVHKAMMILKEELKNQLEALERVKVDRSLNKKEEAIFAEIESNIDDIDNFIKKKLNKII